MIFFVGASLCYLFKRTGSLWSCILVHSIYDLSTFR
jgi:membrane protease YdiL (CAAX protease family)